MWIYTVIIKKKLFMNKSINFLLFFLLLISSLFFVELYNPNLILFISFKFLFFIIFILYHPRIYCYPYFNFILALSSDRYTKARIEPETFLLPFLDSPRPNESANLLNKISSLK